MLVNVNQNRFRGQMNQSIEVKNVVLEYQGENGGVLAVDDVSFSVADSEFLCILGPSGCGKTTILNMLAGFIKPTKGVILIGGRPVVGAGQDRGVLNPPFWQG